MIDVPIGTVMSRLARARAEASAHSYAFAVCQRSRRMTPETARVLLHAFIDGELDAASTIELKAQIDVSPALRQELARLSALQSSVQTLAARFNAAASTDSTLFAALPAGSTQRTPCRDSFVVAHSRNRHNRNCNGTLTLEPELYLRKSWQ